MRSIEYLVQLFPDKTGKEIIAIQEQEKIDDQKEFDKQHAKTLAFIKDLNDNGGYYRGRFGLEQHYFYNVFNVVMDENGEVYMDVGSVVMFFNDGSHNNTNLKVGEIRIERTIKNYVRLDQYGLNEDDRMTEIEWRELNDHLNAMSTKFWEPLPK